MSSIGLSLPIAIFEVLPRILKNRGYYIRHFKARIKGTFVEICSLETRNEFVKNNIFREEIDEFPGLAYREQGNNTEKRQK